MVKKADIELSTGGRGIIFGLAAWSIAWKGLSLWRAARENSKPWFVTLLVSNTLGILDAIYIFGVTGKPRRTKREAAINHPTIGEHDINASR